MGLVVSGLSGFSDFSGLSGSSGSLLSSSTSGSWLGSIDELDGDLASLNSEEFAVFGVASEEISRVNVVSLLGSLDDGTVDNLGGSSLNDLELLSLELIEVKLTGDSGDGVGRSQSQSVLLVVLLNGHGGVNNLGFSLNDGLNDDGSLNNGGLVLGDSPKIDK